MHNNGFGYKPAWSPSPFRHPATTQKLLGQSGGFLDSPVLSLTRDVLITGMGAFLGWGFGQRRNNWSTFWYVVSAVSGFKVLYDLSKIK